MADSNEGRLKIPIFRIGSWKHPAYGVIEGTQDKFNGFIENFRKNVLGRPPFVRLGHTKDNAATFGDAPAEAWVSELMQEGNVLYALAWPTNSSIVEAVKNKRYRFASPEYNPDYLDKETGNKVGPVLEAVGLTNEPFLTRLPETVMLADPPDTIYLDHEEVFKMPENNDAIKKLAEGFVKFFDFLKLGSAANAVSAGLSDDEKKKLAEVDEMKVKLASAEQQLKETQSKVSLAEQNAWASQVEARLTTLVAAGVPPAMCDQAKTILLANAAMGTTIIKLADNKEITMAEQVYATLDALPKEHRIQLSQMGAQSSTKPGQATVKECYGDVVPQLSDK
ncbi:phage recombination related exonuclease [Desulfocucumis palustris]|uniref:Phage recombination related exonuclease n=1 Tax=Desulfocucumis palustris TaxID=1898651 RepID=A0A2L2XCS0_9FIRM|nr:hypothetical protein [Desulfocucumis palustris]GBF34137.1 phage recombination related exonuclease [Desulfocucumis palustris]